MRNDPVVNDCSLAGGHTKARTRVPLKPAYMTILRNCAHHLVFVYIYIYMYIFIYIYDIHYTLLSYN